MGCYIKNIISSDDVLTDIKLLISDYTVRRRMSRILKMAVTTAIECCNGINNIKDIESIITSTGYGCLADSEKFLRNIILNQEDLLNPTPFIQSTFNTVGAQIALLSQNYCENTTYVNRSHSFEDALLDSYLQLINGTKKHILVGAFDEITESSDKILTRMGLFRDGKRNGEGAVFVELNSQFSIDCKAEITRIAFPNKVLTRDECLKNYATLKDSVLIVNEFNNYGYFPTVSSLVFYNAIQNIKPNMEMVICNQYLGMSSTVIVVKGL